MRRGTKWVLGGLAVLLGAGSLLVAGAQWQFDARRFAHVSAEPPPVEVHYDAESIARGEHVAFHLLGCGECHGDDFGGRVFVDDPALGRFAGPNLTTGRGGRGARLGERDWARAIVRGVADAGHPLLIMPSRDYQNVAASDLAALIAYARTRPPVDRELVVEEATILGRVLVVTGAIPSFDAETLDLTSPLPPSPPTGRTLEHGAYLANACVGCHRPTLVGGPFAATPAGCPAPANLTDLDARGYDEGGFVRLFRDGVAADGHTLHTFMPWRALGGMTEEELLALFDYLASLAPQPTGR